MTVLFVGEHPPQVVTQLPVIGDHTWHTIFDDDQQQNDMFWILGPWEKELYGVNDPIDGAWP